MEQLRSHWTDFRESLYPRIFRKSVDKIPVSINSNNNNCTLHADRYTVLIISRLILLRMRNVAGRSCTEYKNIHFVFNNPPPENQAVYEIMWKNIVQRGRPQMATWCMCIACWVPNAKDRHSEYLVLIAFPLQQWLHERASMWRYNSLPVLL